MSTDTVVTILGVVLGSGAFSSLANWMLKRFAVIESRHHGR